MSPALVVITSVFILSQGFVSAESQNGNSKDLRDNIRRESRNQNEQQIQQRQDTSDEIQQLIRNLNLVSLNQNQPQQYSISSNYDSPSQNQPGPNYLTNQIPYPSYGNPPYNNQDYQNRQNTMTNYPNQQNLYISNPIPNQIQEQPFYQQNQYPTNQQFPYPANQQNQYSTNQQFPYPANQQNQYPTNQPNLYPTSPYPTNPYPTNQPNLYPTSPYPTNPYPTNQPNLYPTSPYPTNPYPTNQQYPYPNNYDYNNYQQNPYPSNPNQNQQNVAPVYVPISRDLVLPPLPQAPAKIKFSLMDEVETSRDAAKGIFELVSKKCWGKTCNAMKLAITEVYAEYLRQFFLGTMEPDELTRLEFYKRNAVDLIDYFKTDMEEAFTPAVQQQIQSYMDIIEKSQLRTLQAYRNNEVPYTDKNVIFNVFGSIE